MKIGSDRIVRCLTSRSGRYATSRFAEGEFADGLLGLVLRMKSSDTALQVLFGNANKKGVIIRINK
jgi:hypothetical protein